MGAVQWEADHYEAIPVIVVACLRWATYGPIVSGVQLPFPPFWASIYYGSIFPAVCRTSSSRHARRDSAPR